MIIRAKKIVKKFDLEEVKERIRQKIKEIYEELEPEVRAKFASEIVNKFNDDEYKKKVIIEFFYDIEAVKKDNDKIKYLFDMLKVLDVKRKKVFNGGQDGE